MKHFILLITVILVAQLFSYALQPESKGLKLEAGPLTIQTM